MAETRSAELEPVRRVLARIGDRSVRQSIQRVLVLWELGYLREALAQFRLLAEGALHRLLTQLQQREREPLLEWSERGQSARVIEALYRDLQAIPARVALHLHTLLAWGSYASHHQRRGHHARPSDLAVLVSIAADLEEWMANQQGASIFEQAGILPSEEGELSAQVVQACVTGAGGGVQVERHRLTVPALSLELLWRMPDPAAPAAEPYRGLRAFEPEDAGRFYGRDALRRALEHRVDTLRLTVVSGASGTGKTSLLRAGLTPFLLELGCGVLLLSEYGEPALRTIEQLLECWPARPLVLVLDQLERAFLPPVTQAVRDALLRIVMTAGAGRPGLRVVIGVREDLLGRLLREAEPLDPRVLQDGNALFVVGSMSAAETREAILRPLEGSGVTLDEQLLDGLLLPELVEEAGALPVRLQLVCERLYAAAREAGTSRIDRALHDRLGGTERILSSYLDETLASPHYEGERELARATLRAMTDDESRRWMDLGELWTAVLPDLDQTDEVQLSAMVGKLVDARLVLARGGPGADRGEYTLMHDQLAHAARQWTSSAEVERQLAQERLDRAVAVWADPDRRELLRGRALKLVEAHWRALRRPERQHAEELLAGSRRARRGRTLSSALLVCLALFGLAFGGLQLRRATADRDLAEEAADRGTLLQAQLALAQDPTLSVAWLRNLSRPSSCLGVLSLIEEARRRGVSFVLKGHEHLVTSLAFSPDRRLLVSGSRDGTVRLWDTGRGTAGAVLRGHGDFVNRVAFSPDGRVIAAAGSDSTVRLWETSTGRGLAVLRGHEGAVYGLCFFADGMLASSGADRTIRIWEVPARRQRGTPLRGHGADVMSVACAADGRLLVSGSLDRTVRVWDAETGASLGPPLVGHGEGVFGVAVSRDGKLLASASRDSTVRLWEVATRRELHVLRGHTDWVLSVAFSPRGLLASAGSDKAVNLWDPTSGTSAGRLRGHLGYVHEVAFAPDGRSLASASRDHTVRLWDLATRTAPGYRLEGHADEVRAVAFARDGRTLASAGKDRTVRLWDPTTRLARAAPLPHPDEVLALAFAPDGARLAAGGAGRLLQLWRLAPRPRATSLAVTANAVHSAAFSPEGRLLAAGDSDGRVQLYDAHSGATRGAPLVGHAGPVYALAMARGGLLASAGSDRTIQLWSTASSQPTGSLRGHRDTVFALVVSPDGKLLASGSADGSIRLWDLERRMISGVLTGHRHWVLSLAFGPDGRRIASGSSDGSVRLWDVATRQPVGPPLLGHDDWVYSVAFSPDGRTLASGSSDRTLWIWQLSEVGLERLRQLTESLTNVHIFGDGRVEVR